MYTATDNQKIEVWRFGDRVNTHKDNFECDVVQSYNAHQNVILDLLILENMGTLASASMDETIALWDINTHQLHHELKGHDHGVFGLAYHSEYHALISAAYEHSAIVWNPYCAKIICKLKHGSPLIGVQAVPDSPQILTADKAGVVKVWDIRNFGCVQAFHVEDSKDTRVSEITSFAQIHPHKQLVAGGERLYMQESLTSSSHHSPDVADLEPTIRAIYNSNTSTFITASGQTIKIWKGVNGILQRVYRNITQHEISALCLDHTEKKFIVGDVSGAIHVHNYLNGALMMSVKESDREITSLFYVPELKQILSASWDNCICLLDENQEDGLPLMKRLRHHKDEITCAAISSNLSLYASASCDGFIYLWDFRSHVLGGELLGHKSEVTALAFLDPYPLLVSADSEGNLCFWIVRPLLVNVSKCILRLVNRSKQKSRSSTKVDSSACSVTAIVFLETGTESNLYTGNTCLAFAFCCKMV